MEAYYKDRKKQIASYLKNIKKGVKAGRLDEVERLKKEYAQFLTKSPPFKRDTYMTVPDYLRSLNQRIRESENQFIQLKLDLCYDLHDGLREYDELEKAILALKKIRDMVQSKKREKELSEERSKKQQQDQLKGIMETYFFLEQEDKKVTYQEIEKLSSQMANPNRQVIAYEIEHKELEYRLTQLYEPSYPVKIST